MDVRSIDTRVPADTQADPALSPRESAERRELVRAVRAINKTQVLGQRNELTYFFDRESQRTVARIVNRETREVVRQMPTEEALQLAASLHPADGNKGNP